MKNAFRIVVTLEPPFPAIRAWSFGERWNGWEVPYFEYKEAKRVATELGRDGNRTVFNGGTFRTFNEHDVEPSPEDLAQIENRYLWTDWERLSIQTEAGEKEVFHLGGFIWRKVLTVHEGGRA